MKAQIAKLKEKQEVHAKKSGGGEGYAVKKRGDATVALVGPPSAGKSTLLNAVTDADSDVGDYHFTTLTVVPGMLQFNGANIQILDVPGLVSGAAEGKGGGKQVLSVVRNADLIVFMTDVTRPDMVPRMKQELVDAGIRVNEERPDVQVRKRDRGGLTINKTTPLSNEDALEAVLREYGYVNAEVIIREPVDVDRFVAALSKGTLYLPAVTVINKADTATEAQRETLRERFPDAVFISADTGENLDGFKDAVWTGLDVMRIYMKRPGMEPDMEEPLIMPAQSTVEDVAEKVKSGMQVEAARIWGDSAKFEGQRVGPSHVLQDRDVVELKLRG